MILEGWFPSDLTHHSDKNPNPTPQLIYVSHLKEKAVYIAQKEKKKKHQTRC